MTKIELELTDEELKVGDEDRALAYRRRTKGSNIFTNSCFPVYCKLILQPTIFKSSKTNTFMGDFSYQKRTHNDMKYVLVDFNTSLFAVSMMIDEARKVFF